VGRSTLALAAALSAGCGDGSPLPGKNGELSVLLPRAEDLAGRGLPREAGDIIAARLETLPPEEKGEAFAAMARFYHRAKAWQLSHDAASRALAAGVERPEVLFHVADARRSLHLPGAEDALEKLVRMAPDFYPAQLALGRLRFRTSDPASALPFFDRYFQKAMPADAEYSLALLEHGRALRSAGRLQEAADRFAVLLETDPFEREHYSELATTLYRMRLRKEARLVEHMYRAVSLTPIEKDQDGGPGTTEERTAIGLGRRAIRATRERRFGDAFRSYAAAISVGRADPRLRNWYADLCIHFRRFGEARGILEEALRSGLEPSSGLWWMRGRLHLEVEDDGAALDAFERALAALEREGSAGGPDRGQAPGSSLLLALARAAIGAGDLVAAERAVAAAAPGSAESWEPFYWRGRVLLAAGDAAGAGAQFAEARRRGGASVLDLRHWSAIALEKRGERELAERELEEVVERSPSFVPALEALARLAGPARSEERRRALAAAAALHAAVKARSRSIDSQPLEKCGEDYLDLARLLWRLEDPDFADCLLLAGDLLPPRADVERLVVGALREPRDAFVRLSRLRRLHALEPDDGEAITAIAATYLQFHVRLDEAARLAERLHAIAPSARSWRLRGEAALLRGEREKAVEILRQAALAHPGDAGVKDALARAERGG
jgi:tetratricopeptide (TPR) repeat protein